MRIWNVLTRKKKLDPVSVEQSELGRILNWFDLTALGVGSTLGVGVYVLAGHVARDTAGPSVVLSFFIAAIASVFAGLCYAEFGTRVPRAGSAYIYSYVCVGEFIAFIIGWNLVLEYVIGSASVARGLSLYLDTLLNDTMQKTFIDIAPIHVSFMSAYFDFFSFGISFLLSVALAFGMKESSWANNIFTTLNLGVVLFVIIAGSIKSNPSNWAINPNQTNQTDIGDGYFFPYGIEGMIKGAATCFYGFVGFDCIATTGEEVKNPQKAIPISIILSLLIIFLSYLGTSTVITLMVPYYLQDPDAPIPHAFEMVGWEVAKWIVAIGGIFGLCASLFGAMFPLPRILYAMASDGVIFRILGRVSRRFKTPVLGTLLAGVLTGLMAALFELKHLVNMMSIGTLMAYTIVAASVLLLRGEYDQYMALNDEDLDVEESEIYTESDDETIQPTNDSIVLTPEHVTLKNVIGQLFNCAKHNTPTKLSERIISIEVAVYCILCVLIGICIIYLQKPIINGELWSIIILSIILMTIVVILLSITLQPKSSRQLSFKVPFVPLIPALSVLINIYLMLMLDSATWIRFAVWMTIGLPIYWLSVRMHYTTHPIKSTNGIVNNAYQMDDDDLIGSNVVQTIAVLDEVIDEEVSKFVETPTMIENDMESSLSIENDENNADLNVNDVVVDVVADVHRADSNNVDPIDIIQNVDSIIDNTPIMPDDNPSIITETDVIEPEIRENIEPELIETLNEPKIDEPVTTLQDILNNSKTRPSLKPVPKKIEPPPEPSYEAPENDNLKFHSKAFELFKAKLDKSLKPIESSSPINKSSKNDHTYTQTNTNDNVIVDLIDKELVKMKLNDFLMKTNKFDDKTVHKMNMNDTLDGIRKFRVDS